MRTWVLPNRPALAKLLTCKTFFSGLIACFPSIQDVGLFEAEVLLLVDDLEVEADQHGGHAEAGQHHERPGVVELVGRRAGGVGARQHVADQDREEPQADVLDPEDEGVGRADDLLVHELGNGRPQGGGHQREAGSQHEDRDVGHDGAADGACP